MPQENNTPVQNSNLSYSQLFDEALAFQQQKKWDDSLTGYQKLLDLGRGQLDSAQASAIYHNMATIAYEKADFLKAYIWAKKATTLNPSNQLALDSFNHYSKKFEAPLIAHQISGFDNVQKVISTLPVDVYLGLSLILVLTSLTLFLKTLLLRKKKQLAEDFTAVSKWPFYMTLVASILVLSITYISYSSSQICHALVLSEKAQVQTAPGENKPIIFEAPAGLDLEVLKLESGYYQVRYPGAFSGWVAQTQLELMSLSFEQNK